MTLQISIFIYYILFSLIITGCTNDVIKTNKSSIKSEGLPESSENFQKFEGYVSKINFKRRKNTNY